MTQDEVEAYKRAMLERYEQQRLENEAIRKKLEAEKGAKADVERRKKDDEDARRAQEAAKTRAEEEARQGLMQHRRQQEDDAAQRMLARAPSLPNKINQPGSPGVGKKPDMPMSASGPATTVSGASSNNAPATARRGLPVVDDLYMQAAALAAGRPANGASGSGEVRDVVRGSMSGAEGAGNGDGMFEPAIQLELDTIHSLIESAASAELLISSVPFEPELETEEDRALAAKLAAEEAERQRVAEEARKKREMEADQMAKQLNFNFTIAPPVPVAKKPAASAADDDFDAMLANLQQATADLDF